MNDNKEQLKKIIGLNFSMIAIHKEGEDNPKKGKEKEEEAKYHDKVQGLIIEEVINFFDNNLGCKSLLMDMIRECLLMPKMNTEDINNCIVHVFNMVFGLGLKFEGLYCIISTMAFRDYIHLSLIENINTKNSKKHQE